MPAQTKIRTGRQPAQLARRFSRRSGEPANCCQYCRNHCRARPGKRRHRTGMYHVADAGLASSFESVSVTHHTNCGTDHRICSVERNLKCGEVDDRACSVTPGGIGGCALAGNVHGFLGNRRNGVLVHRQQQPPAVINAVRRHHGRAGFGESCHNPHPATACSTCHENRSVVVSYGSIPHAVPRMCEAVGDDKSRECTQCLRSCPEPWCRGLVCADSRLAG